MFSLPTEVEKERSCCPRDGFRHGGFPDSWIHLSLTFSEVIREEYLHFGSTVSLGFECIVFGKKSRLYYLLGLE